MLRAKSLPTGRRVQSNLSIVLNNALCKRRCEDQSVHKPRPSERTGWRAELSLRSNWMDLVPLFRMLSILCTGSLPKPTGGDTSTLKPVVTARRVRLSIPPTSHHSSVGSRYVRDELPHTRRRGHLRWCSVCS